MDTPITRAEHEEFRRRLEEENRRQDKLNQLTTSVGKLAASVESMVKEQEKQGQRLETLEGRDGKLWRKFLGYVISAVVGIVVGFVFRQAGM